MDKECVLYDRKCIDCGECNMCDLDPKKICDNCGVCIDSGNDYNIMDVELTVEENGMPLNYHPEEDEEENEELFLEEDFEEPFEDSYGEFADDEYYDNEEYDDDDDDSEFDFGEFFGKR